MIRTAWGLSLACTRAHGRTVEALDISPASWESECVHPPHSPRTLALVEVGWLGCSCLQEGPPAISALLARAAVLRGALHARVGLGKFLNYA